MGPTGSTSPVRRPKIKNDGTRPLPQRVRLGARLTPCPNARPVAASLFTLHIARGSRHPLYLGARLGGQRGPSSCAVAGGGRRRVAAIWAGPAAVKISAGTGGVLAVESRGRGVAAGVRGRH